MNGTSGLQWQLTPEILKSMQKKSLQMMLYLKDFCERNGILFYLCGGGCIGAIREHGFIEWDDDLDVMMPREDYERFYRLWQEQESENKKYVCLRTTDDLFTGNIFTTLTDTETTCIKRNQADLDIPQGIVIDIFPLDGCPDGKIKQLFQIVHAMMYSLFLAQVVPEKHGGIVSLGSKILLGVFRGKKIRTRLWRRAERKMSKYSFSQHRITKELCAGPHYMMNKYPQSAFSSSVYKEFDGEMLPVPAGYDDYLTAAFGDYMTPPPENSRTVHHDFVFCDPENSYEKYRGIYYLTDKK